eukprot:ctg_1376.g498
MDRHLTAGDQLAAGRGDRRAARAAGGTIRRRQWHAHGVSKPVVSDMGHGATVGERGGERGTAVCAAASTGPHRPAAVHPAKRTGTDVRVLHVAPLFGPDAGHGDHHAQVFHGAAERCVVRARGVAGTMAPAGSVVERKRWRVHRRGEDVAKRADEERDAWVSGTVSHNSAPVRLVPKSGAAARDIGPARDPAAALRRR